MKFNKNYEYLVLKDSQGRFRVSSLFWELRNPLDGASPPLFTSKDRTHTVVGVNGSSETFPSLREIYLSYSHIPGFEYEFALDVFDSWEHWKAIAESSTMGYKVQEWRDELAIRVKAEALKSLMKVSKQNINAAKYLAEEGYVPKKLGRTSKAEKERIQKIDAGIKNTLKEDMDRLGLKIVGEKE